MRGIKTWGIALIRNIAWLVHPRLPWPIAVRLLERRTRAALNSRYEQAVALDQMAYLLSDVATPEEIERAARAYIEFSLLESEYRWHPRRSTSRRIEGIENLKAAKAEGRGVILHFAHHGFYSGMFGALRKASGIEIGVMVRQGALGWDVGPSLRQHMLVARRGGSLVYAGVGAAGVTERLARGEVIAMASDAPGSSTVQFAGHAVTCSSGAVWTAREANTPIVTIDCYQDEKGPVFRISEPLLPSDFENPKELLQLLVSRHEQAILAWPEATLAPTLAWPRVDPSSVESSLRETSVIVPKPLVKSLVHNAMWLLHPRLPWPLAERALDKRVQKALQSPAHAAAAETHMRYLLENVASPEEIEDAKARYTEFSLGEAELRWHPRRATHQEIEGIENLRAAEALGRGVVVSFVHHAYYAGMFGALKRAGIDHVTVVRAGALGWNSGPGQRQNFMLMRRGGPFVDVREGTSGIIELLAQGKTVMIATDIPGSSTVSFAGRQVRCSSGAIWAAKAANTPIVAVDAHRTATGHVIRFGQALLPEDFEDPSELLQRVVTEHETAILAWPEAAFVPTLSWVSAES